MEVVIIQCMYVHKIGKDKMCFFNISTLYLNVF